MRKIASHYWLRPDGSIGKFPVITFNSEDRIVEIRERTFFKEEPFLELINGFLVPGFIKICSPKVSDWEELEIEKYLNQLHIKGVRVLVVQNELFAKVEKRRGAFLKIVNRDVVGISSFESDQLIGIEKIKEAKNSVKELMKITLESAIKFGIEDLYGSLDEGKTPGLLSISKLDYDKFQINQRSKLKIIL